MRALVQRVTEAAVEIDGERVAAIGPGLLVLLGVASGDSPSDSAGLAARVLGLRIRRDDHSVADDPGAAILVDRQFTLYGEVRRGRRRPWSRAAPATLAEPVVDAFVAHLRSLGAAVQSGVFGADMQVRLVNDGPVTIILDT